MKRNANVVATFAIPGKRQRIERMRKVLLAHGHSDHRNTSIHAKKSRSKSNENVIVGYQSKSYWEDRYAEGKDIENKFEWFLSYGDVEPILKSCIDYNDKDAILVDVGCGTSLFLRDLKESGGYRGPCVGVDYSTHAITAMRERKDCASCKFFVCDATQLTNVFDGETVSVVVDKSLMDTMLHDVHHENVPKMLSSIANIIKPGGYLISITQMDPRKPDDEEFLTRTFIPSLSAGSFPVQSVVAHITNSGDSSLPVPTILVVRFSDETGGGDCEIEFVEYSDDDE
jgi:ubiquinone/menaquinone biosynthesis C-methylase UbiE